MLLRAAVTHDPVVDRTDLNLLLVFMEAEKVFVAARAISYECAPKECDEFPEESFHKVSHQVVIETAAPTVKSGLALTFPVISTT